MQSKNGRTCGDAYHRQDHDLQGASCAFLHGPFRLRHDHGVFLCSRTGLALSVTVVSPGVHPNTKVFIHPISPFHRQDGGVIRTPTATIGVWGGFNDSGRHTP